MVRELAEMSARPRRVTDNLYRGLAPARALAGWIEQAESAGPRDYDALEGLLLKLGRDLRRDLKKGRANMAEASGARNWCCAATSCCAGSRSSGAAPTPISRRAARGNARPGRRIQRAEAARRQARFRRSADLRARLVRDQADVRHYLQDRFTHLFIDEFQDTDPLQAEILLLLASDDPAGNGLAAACARRRESCFWWAIRSNRFTSSGAPISCCTGRSATR